MQHPKRIIQAYFSRLLLLVHGFVAVWHTVWVTGNPLYWGLLTGVGILLGEGVFTLRSTKSGEWKWFSLMVFLYLCTAIPCIWVLELHSLDSTVLTSISPETTPAALQKPDLIRISITAEEAMWTSGVEQTMMLMLVVGRWLMPRGDLSRAQLYELLLVESALGADILDILDTSKQSQVETNRAIRVMGLGVFSWSMIQFPLVLTKIEDSDSYKYSKVPLRDNGKLQVLPKVRTWFRSCISSQVCTLLISLCMQDGPSLVYRLYLLIEKNMKNQMMIFFICQHILLIILQINRIIVYPDCDDEELKDLIELGKERKVKLCTRNNCQTLMSRLVFIFHGLLTVWFVVSMKGESLYWALSTGVLLLFVEALITLCSPYHLDLKWQELQYILAFLNG
ncbi:transmembrane protein 26-like isoform X1 [Polypterus senegalus]|uniref:transmembrane protein 26-like isoform X1 n=1 Tax=Polypterus senegalus TaxID=55291 RepID=UPI0019631A6D|nr:transmembrane protein 26-like isoform X1 [Polypterus senegalus]